ncbi:nuclear transport factor 2 family protein [Opitutus sp. GAS368]|jgi:ketosteroid isomerase-like protein|uniref:nuclear transport factor 2 family protein n=1 Tax=Opitutus sp. GAS368 TaxID=1882749 RepID=UPI00087D6CDD|nr:nuclear transport factor 2 family protein [Opitutus sp. GAS368]SDR76357.1 Ketosteroid isomerase homolog [Opitutus sp. GAS368]
MLNSPSVRSTPVLGLLTAGLTLAMMPATGSGAAVDDAKTVAALDTEFQAAVKRNDAATIGRIQADDMILVTGRGAVFTKDDHVKAAQNRERSYEQQDEEPGTQTVRVWGDTAVVTALLWIKGTARDGKAFDYKLWFSDTYVRTAAGWKYAFGQASLPLPKETK